MQRHGTKVFHTTQSEESGTGTVGAFNRLDRVAAYP